MEMNRVWLLKISIVLQFFANSLNASTIDLGYIQIYDTSQVNEHINLYFKLINTDTANARKCLEEALTISKETGYLNGIARSEYYLGLYYLEQFDLLKAENYFTESYEESGKSGDRTRRATNTNNLGTISEKKGDYGDAILKYLDAFELFDSLNNKIGLSATAAQLKAVTTGIKEILEQDVIESKSVYLKIKFRQNSIVKCRECSCLIHSMMISNLYLKKS